jgi:hypothetical protein
MLCFKRSVLVGFPRRWDTASKRERGAVERANAVACHVSIPGRLVSFSIPLLSSVLAGTSWSKSGCNSSPLNQNVRGHSLRRRLYQEDGKSSCLVSGSLTGPRCCHAAFFMANMSSLERVSPFPFPCVSTCSWNLPKRRSGPQK